MSCVAICIHCLLSGHCLPPRKVWLHRLYLCVCVSRRYLYVLKRAFSSPVWTVPASSHMSDSPIKSSSWSSTGPAQILPGLPSQNHIIRESFRLEGTSWNHLVWPLAWPCCPSGITSCTGEPRTGPSNPEVASKLSRAQGSPPLTC